MTTPLHEALRGRVLGVASMHGKERAIGPAFAERFPLAGCRAIAGLDTDAFGTFSGERRRTLEPRAAAEAKARAGAQAGGLDLVIASEGSFVPHPAVPLLTCDEEWLVLLDLRDGSLRAHRHVAVDVACAGRACGSLDEVAAFAARLPFPEHRLVLRPREAWQPGDEMLKGIAAHDELRRGAAALLARHGRVWVELDLRAHANPTRMRAIAAAARDFAEELATPCPGCGAAHFRVVEALPGLPCSACLAPTRGVRALRRACAACGQGREDPRPDGRLAEEPAWCDACNP